MPAAPLCYAFLQAHHEHLARRLAVSSHRRNQLARSAAFSDQLGIGQPANLRSDSFNVDMLVAVFPRIVHQGIVARREELFGEKRSVVFRC